MVQLSRQGAIGSTAGTSVVCYARKLFSHVAPMVAAGWREEPKAKATSPLKASQHRFAPAMLCFTSLRLTEPDLAQQTGKRTKCLHVRYGSNTLKNHLDYYFKYNDWSENYNFGIIRLRIFSSLISTGQFFNFFYKSKSPN